MKVERAYLSDGRLDLLLASVLAVLALVLQAYRGAPEGAAIDVLACVAAAIAARWPVAGGTALAAALMLLLLLPASWASAGEYAAFIPILGTGIRGQRRARKWMTLVYGAILVLLTLKELRDSALAAAAVAVGVWGAALFVLWMIGDLFTASRNAQLAAERSKVQHERLTVARSLHDTVARDLARASLRAQVYMFDNPSEDIRPVLDEIQKASSQLRWILALLRESTEFPGSGAPTRPSRVLADAVTALESRGFTAMTTVEGDLDGTPVALWPTLAAVISEAFANTERHADPEEPCVTIISVTSDGIDIAFLNSTRGTSAAKISGSGFGLLGLREELALVGGEVSTEEDTGKWITRATIPL